MAIKTFNVQLDIYDKFYRFCKERGLSMSKQIEIFMGSIIAEEPEAKKEYLKKLEQIRKGKFYRVDDFARRYGLKR